MDNRVLVLMVEQIIRIVLAMGNVIEVSISTLEVFMMSGIDHTGEGCWLVCPARPMGNIPYGNDIEIM